MTLRKRPEIVSPAGSWESLVSAISNGADAVYVGIKGLNMRYYASNFDILELPKIATFVHKNHKKCYLALNTTIYDTDIVKVEKILKAAKKSDFDAVILWDMSILSLAKKLGLNIHLSTQASVSNFDAVKFYASLGVKRIVLARECSLEAIKNIAGRIKKEKVKCEIEVFIHGAMCVSISGRCFLSHNSFGKSANRGECLQPCRRKFIIKDVEDECEYVLGSDYILSAKDLSTVEFIDKIIASGVNALKIEGRMRSPEYVSIATEVYREAVDSYFNRKLNAKLKKKLLTKLKNVYNRSFSSGFYLGKPSDTGGRPNAAYKKTYLGDIKNFYKKIRVGEILIRNGSLHTGQEILITGKNTPAGFAKVENIEINHKPIESAEKGKRVGVKLPFIARPGDKVFIWEKNNRRNND